MTPKEKAKELCNKFNDATVAYDSGDYTSNGIKNSILVMVKETKRCAIVAVDEIIKAIDFDWMEVQNLDRQHAYWELVKNEIENF